VILIVEKAKEEYESNQNNILITLQIGKEVTKRTDKDKTHETDESKKLQ
jgi:hypothetical protein